jgi:hypothetical protein
VLGVAVDHYRRENFMGDGYYDVVVLNVDGVGDVAVHCQPTVLSNEMRQARPKPGEKVGVKWLGEKQGAKNTYAAYKVVVERNAGGTFDWGDGTATADTEGQTGSWRTGEDPDPAPQIDDEGDIPFVWIDKYAATQDWIDPWRPR